MAVARCINTRHYRLTEGNNYEIISMDDSMIVIANDNGRVVRYAKNLFTILDEEVVTMTQERPEPLPEPVNVSRNATEQEMSESLIFSNYVSSNGSSSVVVSFTKVINTLIPNETLQININNFSVNGTNISCGVKQLSGLLNIIDSIESYAFSTFEDDYLDFKKSLLIQTLQFIASQSDIAFLLISTAVGLGESDDSEDYNEDNDFYFEALTREFEHSSTQTNPNSERDIKIWMITGN